MSTFKMAVPSGFPNTFVAKSGNSYTQSGGFITGVDPEDVNDLEQAGGFITGVDPEDVNDLEQAGATVTAEIDSLAKRVTAQVDRATSTTLTDITGLSVDLEAGGVYAIRAYIPGVSTANGGAKFALASDGTLTATSFSGTCRNMNGSTVNAATTTTTLGNAIGAATAVFSHATIDAVIVVNAAGALRAQIAQNASHADTTSAYVNGYLIATRIA